MTCANDSPHGTKTAQEPFMPFNWTLSMPMETENDTLRWLRHVPPRRATMLQQLPRNSSFPWMQLTRCCPTWKHTDTPHFQSLPSSTVRYGLSDALSSTP